MPLRMAGPVQTLLSCLVHFGPISVWSFMLFFPFVHDVYPYIALSVLMILLPPRLDVWFSCVFPVPFHQV